MGVFGPQRYHRGEPIFWLQRANDCRDCALQLHLSGKKKSLLTTSKLQRWWWRLWWWWWGGGGGGCWWERKTLHITMNQWWWRCWWLWRVSSKQSGSHEPPKANERAWCTGSFRTCPWGPPRAAMSAFATYQLLPPMSSVQTCGFCFSKKRWI